MPARLPLLLAAIAPVLVACGGPPPLTSRLPPGWAKPTAGIVAAAPPTWIEDDVAAAHARAKAEGKVLLVDAWAPWCHTCLSMKQEVLLRPELGAYSDRVIFAAADTDRPANAALVERYAIEVWPTFFVIDPASDRVLAVHGGAASLDELRGVLDGALVTRASRTPDPFTAALAEGAAAYAARRFDEAGAAYERAGAMKHPRASEALLGAIRARKKAGDVEGCVAVADLGIERVHGAAMAADFTYYVRACAKELPPGPRRAALEDRARRRLRAITADPPPGATVDDRADALSMLAAAEKDAGDEAASRAAIAARVALLDDAAGRAKTPREAAAFDAMRAWAYQDAGRPEDAVRLLEERTRQLPDDYEAYARLAQVLTAVDPARAVTPLRRAIDLSYGPRRVRYLEQEVELHAKLGDAPSRLAALRRLVEAHRDLAPGHADAGRRAKAEAQLAEAEAGAPAAGSGARR